MRQRVAELFGCFGGEGFYYGDVLEQWVGYAVALLQVGGAVPGDPDFAGGVLRDEDLEREVDGDAGGGEHEGRAGFGVAEDEEFGGRHVEADLFGFAAVV